MELKRDYRFYLRQPYFHGFASAVLFGILTHSFAFFNVLHNHDNIASQPGGYGTALSSGRWLLEILGRLSEIAGLNYNLTAVNGLLYVLILAVAAGFLIHTLQLRSRSSAWIVGALFVFFPTVTATMIYRYTVIFYGIGVLFAILAVWVDFRYKFGWALSILLIALSMGIYQAYVPLTIALFVLVLLRQGLSGERDGRQLILQGLQCCLLLIAGLLLYYACLTVSLSVAGISLSDYQSVNTMGSLSLRELPGLCLEAVHTVCSLALRDYCGVANRFVMRIVFLLLGLASSGMIGYILIKRIRNIFTSFVILLLCIAFLLAVGFIIVMVPNGWIYTLMVYSFCLLPCAPLVILECMPDSISLRLPKRAICLLVSLLVFFYGYYANVNYTALSYAEKQISNYVSMLAARVTMTDGFTPDKQWALVGQIEDPLLESPWTYEITYSGLGFTDYLLNQYSRDSWIENYVGYRVPMADEETISRLCQTREFQSMPCWPSAGSIEVLEDVVVVKFQNIQP